MEASLNSHDTAIPTAPVGADCAEIAQRTCKALHRIMHGPDLLLEAGEEAELLKFDDGGRSVFVRKLDGSGRIITFPSEWVAIL